MFEGIPQSYQMRNPFLVLRLVLFGMSLTSSRLISNAHGFTGVLVYVNVLTIGFAAWNLTVLKDLGIDGE